jgi:hypothetical protein
MSATAKLSRRTSPTGLTVWGPLPDSTGMFILWPGPGGGLNLCVGDPSEVGTSVTRIEHPTASGTYDTRKQAQAAVEAFTAAAGESIAKRRDGG